METFPIGPKGKGYVKTLPSNAAFGRFINYESFPVGKADLCLASVGCYSPDTTVNYWPERDMLVVVGEYANRKYAVHQIDPSIIKWKQSKKVAPIAKRFGAKVRTITPYCCDMEFGGDMQGTLAKPKSRVKITN